MSLFIFPVLSGSDPESIPESRGQSKSVSAALFRSFFAVALFPADIAYVPEHLQAFFGTCIEHPSDVQRLL